MKITIRTETPEDYLAIYQLNKLAFEQANESELIEKLRKKNTYFKELSLIAELQGEIVGHILFTPISIKSDTKTTGSLALAPMAVLPAYQNKGIGGELIREGLQAARRSGFKSVIVLGHPHYYPKFGFQPCTRWGIKAPFPVAEEAFMAIELEENALTDAKGIVFYPEELLEL